MACRFWEDTALRMVSIKPFVLQQSTVCKSIDLMNHCACGPCQQERLHPVVEMKGLSASSELRNATA